MRKKLGNNNKISDVIKFAEEHKYWEILDDDEFFVFGGDIGAGADDGHFQLGFTSKSPLKRIPDGAVFHCDGTYNILNSIWLYHNQHPCGEKESIFNFFIIAFGLRLVV